MKTLHAMRNNWIAYLCLLPTAIIMLGVLGFPLVETIRLSVTNTRLIGAGEYVGVDNFVSLLGDPFFWATLRRTIIWTLASVSLKTLLGLGGALLLNENFAGRLIARSLTLLPWIVPISIGAIAWTWLYNGQHGLINGILLRLHIIQEPFELLAGKTSAFIAAVINDAWVGIPFMAIIFLASLQAIPGPLYEAAHVDGATRWQRFWYITLPQLKQALLMATLLSSVWTFNSFDVIWVMTGGGPIGATTTLVIQTFRTAFGSFQFGKASALAVIVFFILSLLSIFYFRQIDLEET
ncbi:MAG: sugar ABC transporter permease [Anaerolineaceae bacterium]|nr:sugar ABC transporter permease [Anaerolineaceae bacterium]